MICNVCRHKIVEGSISHSNLLIITDAPTPIDMQMGYLFASSQRYTTVGTILRRELELLGMFLQDHAVISLWQHLENGNEKCYQIGYNAVLDAAKHKDAILLLGAEVVTLFTGMSVSDVSGLQVDSPSLSAKLVVAMYSPSIAFQRGFGEVRYGLTQWHKLLKQENLI